MHQVPLEEDPFTWEWEFCDPSRLIRHLVSECPRLHNAFVQTALTHPTPWNIVVAFDEFDVGDPTNHEHSRKLMCLSFSFLEFGKERLWSDDFWFTPILVRTDFVQNAVGGWSAMLRIFLNVFLKGPTGISTAGLPLELGEELFHLLAKVSHFVADGDGHRQALEWNGASAIRPCFRHWNLLKLGTDLANRDPAHEFVEFDCAAPERFRLSTTADLHDIADTLVAMKARVVDGRATTTRMKQLRKACGFTCSPSGLLTDRQLGIDIVNACCYDWMHTFLQDGVLTTEAALLVAACVAKIGMTLDDLKNHFREEWCFPRQHKSKGTRLWLIFQDRRVSPHKLKASASEMLQLYGLLRHFFQRHVWTCAEVRDELDAFEAACRCVDILLQAKRGRIDMHEAATLLEDSARQHLLLHIRAHGKAFLKPKHHWTFDIVEQLLRDPFLLDSWIAERLNKRAKAAARAVQNTTRFDSSVLAHVMAVHRNNLREEGAVDADLIGKTARLPGCGALVADRLVHHGLQISVGDVVIWTSSGMLSLQVGRVAACCLDSGRLCCIVQGMTLVSRLTQHSDAYTLPTHSSPQQVWPTEHLELACAWRVDGNVLVVVRFRGYTSTWLWISFRRNPGVGPFIKESLYSL